jgi:D-3-phosphoglycerate dehydrogenase
MSNWKILITDGLEETGLELLRANAQVEIREALPAEELLEVIRDYEALIVRGRTKVTEQVFSAGGELKVVGRAGVGVDNIDLAAANAHGVIVVNSPLATSQAVAEHTLGLMFVLARSITRGDAGMKSGQWLKGELVGVEVQGKVLGVIGMGNIGSTVARLAAALGMQVIGFDTEVSPDNIQARGAEPVSLGELYSRSDFITIHVPLTQETRNMINGQALGLMKRGARLVCAARGGVIDETALLGALESGQVAGAALDVFKQEPPGVSALVTHPAVVATPHIGAQTVEAQSRAARDIAQEVLSALKGEPLRWRVV